MELDQVEMIGGQPLQAALDALEQRGRAPVGPAPAAAVATLGEQVEVAPAAADGAANEDLAVLVALRGVHHVEARVEGAAQQAAYRALAHALIADLRAAKAEHAGHHVGGAEPPSFHWVGAPSEGSPLPLL